MKHGGDIGSLGGDDRQTRLPVCKVRRADTERTSSLCVFGATDAGGLQQPLPTLGEELGASSLGKPLRQITSLREYCKLQARTVALPPELTETRAAERRKQEKIKINKKNSQTQGEDSKRVSGGVASDGLCPQVKEELGR